ncbi:MAG: hypothetical protein E6Q88_13110 [Lysobacteraceae bacterium]|nr:MAG: hypothetical protein E6Q88_13110 [Xanthomonadaceae bacterium]
MDLNTKPTYSINWYGFNANLGLSNGAGFRFDAETNAQADTLKYTAGLRTVGGFRLDADMLRTPDGRIYGLDSAFPLSPDGNGTATLRVDEHAGTLRFDTRLLFSPGYQLNADFLRTPEGRTYGADAVFLIGKDGNGAAGVLVNEPAGTVKLDTKLFFSPGNYFNADFLHTSDGRIYGADAGIMLGQRGSGSLNWKVDEPAGITKFETRWRFDDLHTLNADWARHRYGEIFGGEGTFAFGRDGRGAMSLRVNEPEGTAQAAGQFQLGNRGSLNIDWSKSPKGEVYGANGGLGIGDGYMLNSGFRVNQVEGSSAYTLGVTFPKGGHLNAGVLTDRHGTSVTADTKFDFAKGAGSVVLEGRHGPQLSQLGGSIVFSNPKLDYSGHVKVDDQSGRYRVSEFGAKLTTKGSERYQFTAEAGYRPDAREYYGQVGLTIRFGGGSKASRSEPRDDPMPFHRYERAAVPERSQADEAATFKQKHPTLQQSENSRLYDQAVTGVRKLNAEGQSLPLAETALSLTVLARANGIQDIRYVALGNSTGDGRHNLFIGDGDPSSPASKAVFTDKNAAALASVTDNLQKLDARSLQGAVSPQSTSGSTEYEFSTQAKR